MAAGRVLVGCCLALLPMTVMAVGVEQYWFARAGVVAVNEPKLNPLTVAGLTYGYNVSRDVSFEVDLLTSLSGGESDNVDGGLSLNAAGGAVSKRLTISQLAYLKVKLGGMMLDSRYSGVLSDESDTRLRAVPSLGAGAIYGGEVLSRFIVEAEISYLDSETYMATAGLHLKF